VNQRLIVGVPGLGFGDIGDILDEIGKLVSSEDKVHEYLGKIESVIISEQSRITEWMQNELAFTYGVSQGYGFHLFGRGYFLDQDSRYVYVQPDESVKSNLLGHVYLVDMEKIDRWFYSYESEEASKSERIFKLHYDIWDNCYKELIPQDSMRKTAEEMIVKGYFIRPSETELFLDFGTIDESEISQRIVLESKIDGFNSFLENNRKTSFSGGPHAKSKSGAGAASLGGDIGAIISMLTTEEDYELWSEEYPLFSKYKAVINLPVYHNDGKNSFLRLELINIQLSGTVDIPYMVSRLFIKLSPVDANIDCIGSFNGPYSALKENMQNIIERYAPIY
jgi:hypothetical protein